MMNYRFISPYVSANPRESSLSTFGEITNYCTGKALSIQQKLSETVADKARDLRPEYEGQLYIYGVISPQLIPCDEIGNQTNENFKRMWDSINNQINNIVSIENTERQAILYAKGEMDALIDIVNHFAPEIK